MVGNVTSLTNNGLRDWLIQRVTAIVLAIYSLMLLRFFYHHPGMSYDTWRALFVPLWMKILSLLTLISLVLHAWIGIWTVSTDYVKATKLRLPLQVIIALALLSLIVWGVEILWSV